MNEMRKFRLRTEFEGRLYWVSGRTYSDIENARKKAKELTEQKGRPFWIEENGGSAT